MTRSIQPTRDSRRREATRIICPTCGSMPGFLCVGKRGNIRISLHADRIAASRGENPA